jgi:hypothetical protein
MDTGEDDGEQDIAGSADQSAEQHRAQASLMHQGFRGR